MDKKVILIFLLGMATAGILCGLVYWSTQQKPPALAAIETQKETEPIVVDPTTFSETPEAIG